MVYKRIIQKKKKSQHGNNKTNSNNSKIRKIVNKRNALIENTSKKSNENMKSKGIPIASKIRKSSREKSKNETNSVVSKIWKLENENDAIIEIAYHIPVDAIFEDLHKLEKKLPKGIY